MATKKQTSSASNSGSKAAPNSGGKGAAKGAGKASKKTTEHPALFLLDDEDPAVLLARDLGGPVAGLDEAGRGPLAGPVVAACVVLPHPLPECLLPLNDSKALDEEAREALFPIIQQEALAWGIAVVEAARIDEINILRASLEAMAISLESCERMLAHRSSEGRSEVGGAGVVEVKGALLDGNQRAPLLARVVQKTLVGGDAKSRPIMAASILAKVARDRRMKDEHLAWPVYGFDIHKGYPTPKHQEALKLHGPCPLHRRSFAPVRDAVEAAAAAATSSGASSSLNPALPAIAPELALSIPPAHVIDAVAAMGALDTADDVTSDR